MSQPPPRPEPPPVLLVAYGFGPMSDAQLHLACRSADDQSAVVRVLHVIERSRHIPLSAPLSGDEQARVDALFDRAERIVRRYGVACQLEAHQARAVGAAIVADAMEHHAQAIFIGLRDRDRPSASLLISGTVRHVLQNAPCPVQIGYLPASLPDTFARDSILPPESPASTPDDVAAQADSDSMRHHTFTGTPSRPPRAVFNV